MGMFVREDKIHRAEEPHTLDVPGSRQEPVSVRDVQANLGAGSRIEGKLTFEGSVRIDGVIIGESAVITAQIQANTVVIHGRVQGDVTARKRVELRAPARLIGNLNTPSVVMNEGIIFEGHCTMGTSEAQSERGEKKIALFPKDDRGIVARRSSEG